MDLLDDIFDQSLDPDKDIIFNDRNVLRTNFIPEDLPFRENQLTDLGKILSVALKNSRPSNLLLYGKTGTGKTVVTKYVTNQLKKKSIDLGLNLQILYCNTRLAGNEYKILFELNKEINYCCCENKKICKCDIPFTGLSVGIAAERLLYKISFLKLNTIIILDEIDYLIKKSNDDLLYEISRANESLENGFITLIGISNDLKFKEFLDPRVLSSLNEEEIIFSPYNSTELQKILISRSKIAFKPNVIQSSAINLCAALSGLEHGDARRAVDTLRVAGEIAERDNDNKVVDKHVRIALQKIEQDRLNNSIKTLPLHDKIVILSLYSSSTKTLDSTGTIYNIYIQYCKKLNIDFLTQRSISSIINELSLLGIISSTVISEGRYGRTKKIKKEIDYNIIKNIFLKDDIIQNLL